MEKRLRYAKAHKDSGEDQWKRALRLNCRLKEDETVLHMPAFDKEGNCRLKKTPVYLF